MALICAISGVQPEEPCLSSTGYIFERRLIEKHLAESSVCPVSGEPLTVSDLTPIKSEILVKPRPATASSIPGLLSLLQSEWDALALETFNLRSHVDIVRKQLSYNLYQHDAATRVIARLLKERDRALQEVEALQQQLRDFKSGHNVHAFEIGIDDDAKARLEDLAKALMGQRKKRDLSHFCDFDEIKGYKLTGEYRIHSSTIPGINAVVVDAWRCGTVAKASDDGPRTCFTGGADGSVVLFDLVGGKTLCKITSHLKGVNTLASHPLAPILISGSDDKTIRVFKGVEDDADVDSVQFDYKLSHIFKHHQTAITDLSLHPSGEYLLSFAGNGPWASCDLDTGKVVHFCKEVDVKCQRGKCHPDGLIVAAAGLDGAVHVWDFRQCKELNVLSGRAAENGGSASAAIVDIDFSENGYHMASISANGLLQLWDLRSSKEFASADCNADPRRVKFDPSGRCIAVASTGVELFHFIDKTSIELGATFKEGHESYLTDLAFGSRSDYLLTTCSKDRALRLFS